MSSPSQNHKELHAWGITPVQTVLHVAVPKLHLPRPPSRLPRPCPAFRRREALLVPFFCPGPSPIPRVATSSLPRTGGSLRPPRSSAFWPPPSHSTGCPFTRGEAASGLLPRGHLATAPAIALRVCCSPTQIGQREDPTPFCLRFSPLSLPSSDTMVIYLICV